MFKAIDLAYYIAYKYKEQYQSNISKIKLQKTLYFLFAYWGGFIGKSESNKKSVEENLLSLYDKFLFNDEIQAWTYGPVIPNVYLKFNILKTKIEYEGINNILSKSENSMLKSFIDDLITDLFKVSDFKLVDISHSDYTWKNNYHFEDENHNEPMPKDDIVNEYIKKQYV